MAYSGLQLTPIFQSAVFNLNQAYHIAIHFVFNKVNLCIAFVLKA